MIKQYYKQALAQLTPTSAYQYYRYCGDCAEYFPYYVGSDDATSKGRSFFSRVQS